MIVERRAALALAALALTGLVIWALVPTYPNYDAYYHLVWGRELLDGAAPGFDDYSAPTQHPLFLLASALIGLLGEHADRVLVLVTVLFYVAFVAGVFRLGKTVFGELAGWVAALLAGSSFALLLYASRAYVDVPFLALVIWAGVLVAEKERFRSPVAGTGDVRATSHRAPMLLLLLAGLLRPEAWVLAGALWLWRGWRRFDLLALAVAAPLIWALVDLIVTGDPLFSLHSTSDLADELNRSRGLDEVPSAFVRFLFDTAREPVAVAGVVGMGLAWVKRRDLPGWQVPFALFLAGAVTFAGMGVAGLSILPRYLTVPAVALCLFAAYALTRNRIVLAVAVAAGLIFVVVKVSTIERLTAELRFGRAVHADLIATLDDPAIRRALDCGPLTMPTYRLVPEARWHLDATSDVVFSRTERPQDAGVAIVVRGERSTKRYGEAAGVPRRTNDPPSGWERGPTHGRFVSYLRCDQRNPRGQTTLETR